MRTGWKVASAAAAASVVCLVPAAAQAACTAKSNLEAIIDDSGSMSYNDPADLRVAALDLFIDTQGNEKRTLGAVEFGTDANPLFGPGLIGPNAAAYKAAAKAALVEDGGGTDYNDAFSVAGSHNPTADGRIFLTDGEHNEGTYGEGHRGGPPVYVIGLGAGSTGGPNDELLRRIASETGGLYRRADDATQLQAAMFDLNSAIACQAPPKRFVDAFNRVGQSRSHSVKIPSRINTAQFAVTWGNAADAFTIGSFRIVRHGKVVARSARKVRRLKVSRRRGSTFTAVRVSGLRAGKLVFKLRATKLSAPGTPVSLTTQVTRKALR
jgi:hypothetical protein